MRRLRRKVQLGIIAAVAGVATLSLAAPADASVWSWSGANNMKAFVAAPTPTFYCYNGYTGVYPINIKSAGNLNMKVYETLYWYYWTSAGWTQWSPSNASPQPGGISVPRGGATRTISGKTWWSGHFYWKIVSRLDFANADNIGPFLGTVWITPNQASDYAGGGISYYCHS